MATKRQKQDFEEAPFEKRGRLGETNEDQADAELDDEVERELREFEQLQSGLLDTTREQGNRKIGAENQQIVEKESKDQENASVLDLEPLDDLEQQEAGVKNIDAREAPASKESNRSQLPIEETVPSRSIPILPATFAEKNLHGDNLVEKLGISENGEEACLDIEQLRLIKDSTLSDPLLTPPDVAEPSDSTQNGEKVHYKVSKLEISEAEKAELIKQAYAGTRSPELYCSDDNSNDPDFPSPGKRKSRSRTRNRRSISSRSQPRNSPRKKQTDKRILTKSPETKRKHDPHCSNIRTNAKPSEPVVAMIGRMPSPPSHLTSPPPLAADMIQYPALESPPGPKDAFVDPVLKIPSLVKDPTYRDTIFDLVPKLYAQQTERSGDKEIPQKTRLGDHVRAIDFNQPENRTEHTMQHNSNQPESVESMVPWLKSPSKMNSKQGEKCVSPGLSMPEPSRQPAYWDFPQHSENVANPAPHSGQYLKEQALANSRATDSTYITRDQPEYCVIERIIQRRFKNSFSLDSEKLEMVGGGRPTIVRPELQPYFQHYENHTWLAVCNELKRFFCWPCLFFATKLIWSVNCDDNPVSKFGAEINKHIQSPAHQESIKEYDLFMMKNTFSVIKKLMGNNFERGSWTDQDQEAIIMKGRPRPILNGMASPNSETNNKIAFERLYNQVKWLCGCTETRKFYCWPCLLFGNEKSWNASHAVKPSETWISEHEMELEHMAACLKLGKREFESRKNKPEVDKEDVEKSHSFLTSLVEILCAEKKKINNTEFSSMDFLDTLELMSEYNGKLRFFIEGKLKISKVAAAQVFSVAILESVEFFVKAEILEEMKNSNFISLIFDHSSGLSNKSILSVIARYVNGDGKVHERFVKLLNVGYNTPSTTLADEFFQVITELQCRSTLVGFTYDGYLVRPGDMPEFNEKVQNLCPNAKFFHYSEHNFKRVLKQTLCHVPTCRKVLQSVLELATFFETTPGARKGLLDIVTAAEKSDKDGVWRSSNFITTVFVYHAVIVEIMENICKNAQAWKVKTVVQATGFLDFFKDSTNRFFITVMARIFSSVEDLSKELRQGVGIENMKTIATHTALKLQKLGRNFDSVLDSACSHLEASHQHNIREEMLTLREQFSSVIRLAVKLVKNRIFGLEGGYFKMSQEAPASDFKNFLKLNDQYLVLQNVALPLNFNSTKLSDEIQFFHTTSLAGLNLSEIISYMIDYNMVHVLPELFKLLQLALTIPKKQYDSTIPAVRRVSSYIEGKKDLNSADALIWMEKELLSNLQKNPSFYQRVIDRVMTTKKEVFEQFSK